MRILCGLMEENALLVTKRCKFRSRCDQIVRYLETYIYNIHWKLISISNCYGIFGITFSTTFTHFLDSVHSVERVCSINLKANRIWYIFLSCYVVTCVKWWKSLSENRNYNCMIIIITNHLLVLYKHSHLLSNNKKYQ